MAFIFKEVSLSNGEAGSEERLFGRDFVLVCACNFLAFFSIYLIIPILPLFLEEKGYSNFLIGALMSMLLIPTLLRPFLGKMSDLRGRKALLVGGTLLLAVTTFFYAAFASAGPLFLVRFVNGFGLAAFHTAAFALISDLSPPSRRLQGIAMFFISVDITIGTAPLVAKAIKDTWGFQPVYYLAGALALLAFMASLLVREKRDAVPLTVPAVPWRSLIAPLHRVIFVTTMSFTFTFGSLSTFIILSSDKAGISQGELFFTAFAVTLLAFRLGVGRKADRWRRRSLILVSGLLAVAGLMVIAFAGNLLVLILGTLVYALGFAYLPTTLSALLLDHTPEGSRGVMLGLFLAAFDIGMALGGLTMGPVADRWGYTAMYLAGGGVALAGLVYFFLRTGGLIGKDEAGFIEEEREVGPLTEF